LIQLEPNESNSTVIDSSPGVVIYKIK